MSILAIADVLGLKEVASTLVNRLVKDKNLKGETDAELALIQAELEKVLVESSQQAMLAQIKVNEQEAKHPSIFVSGWRPFIGWVCGCGFMYKFAVFPTLLWITATWYPEMTVPEIGTEDMRYLLGGMLGFGGIRTFEKLKGVERSSI